MVNAITVDVEDWFQVSVLRKQIDFKDWDKQQSRIVPNICKILKTFEEYQVKGTFFVLGWIAEKYPEIVLTIKKYGHEIGSHSYAHKIIYEHSKGEFIEDLEKSIAILEHITQERIRYYRAPSFAITKQSLWALEALSERGILYDSSIFPIKHDLYGMPTMPRFPFLIKFSNGKKLIEYPMSTLQLFGENIPFSGGGYLRLLPYWFVKKAIRRINRTGKPAIIYFHPWELDPHQPRLRLNAISRFRHYSNLEDTETKIRALLSEFRFSSLGQIRESLKIDYQWPSANDFQMAALSGVQDNK